MKPYRGPPMTLGNATAARVRLIVWCRCCRQIRFEPDPAEMAGRCGAETHAGASGRSAPDPYNWPAMVLNVVLRLVPTKVNAAMAATAINAAISAYSMAVTPD